MAIEDSQPAESVARARGAAEAQAWDETYEAFARADQESLLDVEDLEVWATAGYLLGRPEEAVHILARLYQLHLDENVPVQAARIGFWIVFMLTEQGEAAQANGWFSKSVQLVERLPSGSLAHGYMLALEAYRLIAVEEEYELGLAKTENVIRLADDSADPDLGALALNLKGRAMVRRGQIAFGLKALDEAMVEVVSGRLSPVVVGSIYCSLIESCEEIGEVHRAREWTGALARWCDRQNGEVPFSAECRVHRSKVLQQGGDMKEAEKEARRAYEDYTRTPYERATGTALYQVAELQRMAGRYAEAEDSYRQASDWGFDPQPGLAMLRVAQGETERALASMRRCLHEATGAVDRIRLLPAYVEVLLASGDTEEADRAATELDEHSSAFGTDALKAQARYSRGMVELAVGEFDQALGDLRRACEIWQSLAVPYEVARTRAGIARACRATGDEETASLELNAARRQFDELGTVDPTGDMEVDPSHSLTPREIEVLGLLATGATNKSIAEQLYVAVRTVDRHVSNILTKLGVSSRTGAVSYAHEHDLV